MRDRRLARRAIRCRAQPHQSLSERQSAAEPPARAAHRARAEAPTGEGDRRHSARESASPALSVLSGGRRRARGFLQEAVTDEVNMLAQDVELLGRGGRQLVADDAPLDLVKALQHIGALLWRCSLK